MKISGRIKRSRRINAFIRPRARRAVTLLEVLVAMGVMVVGLLGMLALIPLGRMELVEAERLDNASTIGRWAFRDITVRGYLQPENWVDPVTGGPVFGFADEPDVPYTLTDGNKVRGFATSEIRAHVPPIAPIVIDPLMITPRKFTNANDDTGQRSICRLFPYSLNLPDKAAGMPELEAKAPKIARVSLRAVPADVICVNPRELMMKAEIASRFFRSSDDLVFDVPQDTSKRPIQVFSKTSAANSNVNIFTNDGFANSIQTVPAISQRTFRGAYSWFLVAEPSLAECYTRIPGDTPAMGGPGASAVSVRQYRTWVIACHQRPLNAVANETLARSDGIGERLCFVDFIDRNTARLRVGGANNEGDALNSLNVKANQWLAVVGRYAEPLLPGGERYIMEWYRITGVADRPTHIQGTSWYREVTLVGREFSGLGFSFIDESGLTYDDINAGLSGQPGNTVQPMTGWGIICTGVRGVYEKSIYVDRPSLYSIRY
jgi:hypothetical protein